ncbi:MAG: hypothetical protein A2046_01400 [Bacteroidetes bacterium GWA2_30_7]|nr:MAG: hypothetical protein A2046_01400 [Bacteroidetes bacterium GWA2_30_7]
MITFEYDFLNERTMKTVIVNIPNKKEQFFLSLLKEFRYKSRVLTEEEKEDNALLTLMYERENEDNLQIESSEQILKNI